MWVYLLIGLFAGGLIGFGVTRLSLAPKLKAVEEIDQNVVQKNIELQQEQSNLIQSINQKKGELSQLVDDVILGQARAKSTVDQYYNDQLRNAKEKLAFKEKELQENYEKVCEEFSEKCASDQIEYMTTYRETLEDCVAEFQMIIAKKAQELNALNYSLADAQSKVNAAVAANKRAEEEQNKIEFYRIQLSDIDKEEIKKLRAVIPYLREAEPLNKVIWKIYYENPTTDLIGRVIGSGIHTGIYKITNTINGKCYVGQAVNLAERWKQHIKRGIGADTPTRNKLYPAMYLSGVENFTFEVVEECDRNQLDIREDYWQDFFKAREFGYSIK